MDRKEGGLSPMKINVSHRLNSSIFAEINKLGSGLKKKGKKSKGKPGKKRIQSKEELLKNQWNDVYGECQLSTWEILMISCN